MTPAELRALLKEAWQNLEAVDHAIASAQQTRSKLRRAFQVLLTADRALEGLEQPKGGGA